MDGWIDRQTDRQTDMSNVISSFGGYTNVKNQTKCVILVEGFLTIFFRIFYT